MLFDDPANLDPDKILEWLNICSHGLNLTRKSVLAALPSGTLPRGISAGSLVGFNAREIEEYFDECQIEMDLFTVLTIIASAEAKIRIDTEKRRVIRGNPLSERLTILFKNAKSSWGVPLYEGGILEDGNRIFEMF